MINQPTSQSMNRHSLPVNFIRYGGMTGAVGGLVTGIYKGLTVTNCPVMCKSFMAVTEGHATLGEMTMSCCNCAGISLGIAVGATCLGAITFGSVGYACAEPWAREQFCQELDSGRLLKLIYGPRARSDLRADNRENISNPVFDPTDDASGESCITSHPMPAPPAYGDLFPEPPSYEDVTCGTASPSYPNR